MFAGLLLLWHFCCWDKQQKQVRKKKWSGESKTIYMYVPQTSKKKYAKRTFPVLAISCSLLVMCFSGIILLEVCGLMCGHCCVFLWFSFLACAPESSWRRCVLKANATKAPVASILKLLTLNHDYRDRGFTRAQFNSSNVYVHFSLSHAPTVIFSLNFTLCCSSNFSWHATYTHHIGWIFCLCKTRENVNLAALAKKGPVN